MKNFLIAGFLAASVTAVLTGCSTATGASTSPTKVDALPQVKVGAIAAEKTISDQTKRAIEMLEEKVAKNPSDLRNQSRLGFAYMQAARETGNLDRYLQARTSFEAAVKTSPKDPESLHNLAWCLTSFHEFPKAIQNAKLALDQDPKDAFAYGVLFDAYYELGRYDEAAEAAQKMVDLRPDMASYSRAAQMRWILGDVKGAQWLMSRAITAGGDFTQNTLWCKVHLAEMQFKEGSMQAAEQNLAAVLKSNPTQAAALAGMARLKVAKGKPDEALKLYEKSIESAPQMAVVLELASLQTSLKNNAEAAKAYEMIPVLIAKHQAAGISGDELMEATYELEFKKNPKRAVEIMEEAAKGHSSVPVNSFLGWCYLQNDQLEEADGALSKAVKVGTQDALLWYRAAKAKHAMGNKEEAKKLALAATNLNPNFDPILSQDARQMMLQK